MANKVIQLKDGADNLYPKTARAINTVSGTTGTSLYNGMYYVDIATGVNLGDVIDIRVSTQSNRPAYCVWISTNQVRAYTTTANTTVTLEIVYEK